MQKTRMNLLRNSVGFRNQKYWDLIDGDTKIEQVYRTYAGKLITVNMRYKKPKNFFNYRGKHEN